jgi:hypothetical protein
MKELYFEKRGPSLSAHTGAIREMFSHVKSSMVQEGLATASVGRRPWHCPHNAVLQVFRMQEIKS